MIFVYQPGSSFLHRMDVVSKLCWLIAVGVFVIVSQHWIVNAVVFGAVLLTGLVLGQVSGRMLLRLIPLGIVSLWLFVVFSFIYPGGVHPVATLGPLRATQEGMLYGLAIGLRVLSLGTSSLFFAATTDPRRMVNELTEVLHVPYRLAFGFYAALRFLPLLQTEVGTILAARAVRGQGKVATGLGDRWRLLQGVTVTVLSRMIRRVQIMAVAMDSRGFGAYPTRTSIDDIERPALGVVFAALWVAAVIGYVLVAYVIVGAHGLQAPVTGNR